MFLLFDFLVFVSALLFQFAESLLDLRDLFNILYVFCIQITIFDSSPLPQILKMEVQSAQGVYTVYLYNRTLN